MGSTGRYIALEGSEGCGKSTQAARLAADLDAVLTREQGGTRIGQIIRGILLNPEHRELGHRSEALLNAADRAQLMVEVVAPAVGAGRHVVSDRSVYSTLAYQGYGRGLPLDELRTVNHWAIGGRWPDLAVLIEVDPATLDARTSARVKDRFELESGDFHQRVRHGFAEMATADPAHWAVVDGNADPDTVYERLRAVVRERLGI